MESLDTLPLDSFIIVAPSGLLLLFPQLIHCKSCSSHDPCVLLMCSCYKRFYPFPQNIFCSHKYFVSRSSKLWWRRVSRHHKNTEHNSDEKKTRHRFRRHKYMVTNHIQERSHDCLAMQIFICLNLRSDHRQLTLLLLATRSNSTEFESPDWLYQAPMNHHRIL